MNLSDFAFIDAIIVFVASVVDSLAVFFGIYK